jgi:hypothetical protein
VRRAGELMKAAGPHLKIRQGGAMIGRGGLHATAHGNGTRSSMVNERAPEGRCAEEPMRQLGVERR